MSNPTLKLTTKNYCDKIVKFERFWVKEPRHPEIVLAKECYLYGRPPLQQPTGSSRGFAWPKIL